MNVKEIKRFILAGRAKFVLLATKSGRHITYKVNVTKDDKDAFFVSTQQEYLGILKRKGKSLQFRLTKKSPDPEKHIATGSFIHFIHMIKTDDSELPSCILFEHTGQCGRCGRELTDPTSIAAGLGPYCINQ